MNRFGIRKPVYRAFELLHQAGDMQYNVTAPDVDSGVVLFATTNHTATGTASKELSLLLANHNPNAVNTTVRIEGASVRHGRARCAGSEGGARAAPGA